MLSVSWQVVYRLLVGCKTSIVVLGRILLGLFRNRNSWNKSNNCSFLGYSYSRSGYKTFIVTLLTGSDMSVINSGPKRKDYSDQSSYSYSGIGPKERALTEFHFTVNTQEGCSTLLY